MAKPYHIKLNLIAFYGLCDVASHRQSMHYIYLVCAVAVIIASTMYSKCIHYKQRLYPLYTVSSPLCTATASILYSECIHYV